MPPTSKPRRLFQALSVLSAVACILLIVLWVRSYWWSDQFHFRYWGRNSLLLATKDGRLSIVAHTWMNDVFWRTLWLSYATDDEMSFPKGPVTLYERFAGFGLMDQPQFRAIPTGNRSRMRTKLYFGPATPAGPVWIPTWLEGSGVMLPFWAVMVSIPVSCVTSGYLFSTQVRWAHGWFPGFSLKALLIATTLVAAALGLFALAMR